MCEEAFDAGDIVTAIGVFSSKLAAHGNNVNFLKRRCEALMASDNHAEALRDALKIISIDKKQRSGYIMAANCYLAIQDDVSAIKIIEQFMSLNVEDLKLQILQSYDQQKFDECVERITSFEQLTCELNLYKVLKAKCFFKLENFSEAKKWVTNLNPSDAEYNDGRFILANCFYSEGELSASISILDKILHDQPELELVSAQAEKVKRILELVNQAEYFIKVKNYHKAVKNYDLALETDQSSKIVTECLVMARKMALSKTREVKFVSLLEFGKKEKKQKEVRDEKKEKKKGKIAKFTIGTLEVFGM